MSLNPERQRCRPNGAGCHPRYTCDHPRKKCDHDPHPFGRRKSLAGYFFLAFTHRAEMAVNLPPGGGAYTFGRVCGSTFRPNFVQICMSTTKNHVFTGTYSALDFGTPVHFGAGSAAQAPRAFDRCAIPRRRSRNFTDTTPIRRTSTNSTSAASVVGTSNEFYYGGPPRRRRAANESKRSSGHLASSQRSGLL